MTKNYCSASLAFFAARRSPTDALARAAFPAVPPALAAPGEHMTGPSLGPLNRKAASARDFMRYSEASSASA